MYPIVMVVLQGIIGCTCDSKLYCARAVSWKNASVLQIKIWNSFCVHMAIVNQSGFFPKWMAFFQQWTAAVKWLVALPALIFFRRREIMNWMIVWGTVAFSKKPSSVIILMNGRLKPAMLWLCISSVGRYVMLARQLCHLLHKFGKF